jgi:hypothetical protein
MLNQLCARLEAGIKGRECMQPTSGVRELSWKKAMDFLLVDVCDAFPEFSQAAMACYGLLDMT